MQNNLKNMKGKILGRLLLLRWIGIAISILGGTGCSSEGIRLRLGGLCVVENFDGDWVSALASCDDRLRLLHEPAFVGEIGRAM